MTISAYKGKVLVSDLDNGEQVRESGIVLKDDASKESGIHPRWAKVHAVGEGVTDIMPGDFILVDTGRWSRNIEFEGTVLNLVDYPKGVLLVADKKPQK